MTIPELRIDAHTQWIRVPAELDVPVTARVKAILDSAGMRRLAHISQLGLVNLVYPGAAHSRFEHSLGVYRLAVQVLQSLFADPDLADGITNQQAKEFLVAALVHDIGHWPYCHPMEDMRQDWIPHHEDLARHFLLDGEVAQILADDWDVSPASVFGMLIGDTSQPHSPLLRSILSGPIDVDKMDYLQRDSLHAGVPYGRNFDVSRLIHSLCAGPNRQRVAITEKGKTAAEMMVFARYVMFSEVYWHHAVRSATAMLQRAIYEVKRLCPSDAVQELFRPERCLNTSESELAESLLHLAATTPPINKLLGGLFGPRRSLYKRLAQYNVVESSQVHAKFSHRPYAELVRFSELLSQRLCRYVNVGHLKSGIQPCDVLIDAPPVKLEVQFDLDVRVRSRLRSDASFKFQSLASLSPVVRTLATEQFDQMVKRVRVLVAPELIGALRIDDEQLTSELLELE